MAALELLGEFSWIVDLSEEARISLAEGWLTGTDRSPQAKAVADYLTTPWCRTAW
jgi:hypothetical protein